MKKRHPPNADFRSTNNSSDCMLRFILIPITSSLTIIATLLRLCLSVSISMGCSCIHISSTERACIDSSDDSPGRSFSMYIRNNEGKVIGSLCINLDITESIQFESFLKQYNKFEMNDQPEYFATNVESLLDYLIQQATAIANKDPKKLSKSERMDFLSFLDENGALQITKSGDRICKVLGISKFTLYNDLEIIRSKISDNEEDK